MSTGKFGRYVIKGEIGRGGMATVFHAYDPRFERDVAIKVLPREFLHDPQFRTRFDREAKMVALLEHPAIVPVYDFGEEEGQPYIVMRYLSGGSLADRIQDGPMPIDEVVKTIVRLAPALDAAHAKGIIHRDLKPGNILFDQYGNAFLSDFGIAHLSQTTTTTLTGGAVLGTPAYMSPEQVQGDDEIDGRSDIYALGVILFQMLTGKTPYQAETVAKLMMMHILEPVPHILDVNAELPAAFEDVIATAMAKRPDDRFQTTHELAEGVRAAAKSDLDVTSIRSKASTGASATLYHPRATQSGVSTPESPIASTPPVPPASEPPAVAAAGTTPVAKRKSPSVLIIAGALFLLVIGVFVIGSGAIYLYAQAQDGNEQNPLATATSELVSAALRPSETIQPSETTAQSVAPSATLEPSPLPTETPAPTNTETAPPPTPTYSDTPVPTAPVLGGADMIAFFRERDVWVVKLDGSELTQLTTDGGTKSELQWTPDGQALVYISGLCVKIVRLSDTQVNDVVCFEYAGTVIEEFEISPDGSHAAISVNQELYIIPYDLEKLKEVDRPSKVKALADCPSMAPYSSNTGTAFAVLSVRWSQDMQQLAILMKILYGQQQEDAIRLMDISNCNERPAPLDEFPSTRFRMGPVTRLENFGWDGYFNFSLVKIERNEGFGDLYFYNSDLHKPDPNTNPIDGVCCYRAPNYSPDGSYIAFAFQDIRLGVDSQTQLYYIPVGTLFTGLTYIPVPLPEGFFSDVKENPEPVARPATSLP
jgi:serine/threonine-protein kinase